MSRGIDFLREKNTLERGFVTPRSFLATKRESIREDYIGRLRPSSSIPRMIDQTIRITLEVKIICRLSGLHGSGISREIIVCWQKAHTSSIFASKHDACAWLRLQKEGCAFNYTRFELITYRYSSIFTSK